MQRFLLLLIFVAAGVYLITRGFRKSLARREDHQTASMVRCAYCNVYVPREESVHSGDKNYCCKEHSKLAR